MTGGDLDEMLDEDPYSRGRRGRGRASRPAAAGGDRGYRDRDRADRDRGDYGGAYDTGGYDGDGYDGTGGYETGGSELAYANDYDDDYANDYDDSYDADDRDIRGHDERGRDEQDWQGGWDDEPGDRPRGRALPRLLAVLVVIAVLLGLGIYGVGKVVGHISGGGSSADYAGSGQGIAVVQIPAGATSRDIAGELHDAGVTASVSVFVKAAAADPRSLGIQPGTYRLRSRMSAAAALTALLDPASSAPFKFVIKEGMTVREVLTGLHERLGTPMADLEAIARNPAQLGLPSYATGLEGYLFPSTYDLTPGATPVALLRAMVDRFTSQAASIDLAAEAAKDQVKPSDIVIIASIIQKEVAKPDEGPKAARVIYNRLHDTSGGFRRLDMDSTTRYAENEYEGPLSRAQLQAANPYNTRAVAGLPPGAISNPGVWALKSALHPVDGTWFYFVSMPQTGETKFATTSAEFAQLQAEYRREGGRE